MAEWSGIGMRRRDLEREVRWQMRKAPDEPGKMPEFLTDLVVGLIDKNNEAIAAALAERDRSDLPEEG